MDFRRRAEVLERECMEKVQRERFARRPATLLRRGG